MEPARTLLEHAFATGVPQKSLDGYAIYLAGTPEGVEQVFELLRREALK